MAIIINDNLAVNAGKPIDSKYLNISTPWISTGATNAGIPLSYRYTGLTVNINGEEYWYKNGVANANLILKTASGNTVNAITGATNIGYFSGKTGIQILPIDNLVDNNYDGNYYSLYNYYYRGTDGIIHIGTPPSDNISKRGYVKTTSPIKSWLWNEYTSSGNLLGWILVDGNISQEVGVFQPGVTYYNGATTFPYSATSWTTGSHYNNTSNVVINTVLGSLTTGTTLTVGGRPFARKVGRILDFRTIISDTPTMISVWDDESLIHLSGTTGNILVSANNGLTKIGQTVKFGGTLTGSTVITDARTGSTAVGIQYGADYSANYTCRSIPDVGYVNSKISPLSSGQRITKIICQSSHGFVVNNVIGWSGGTYNKAIADGTYDGEVVGIVNCCYNVDCFALTQVGYVTGLTASFITNCTYFLSDVTRGLMTIVEPTINSHISRSIMIADSSTSGWVFSYPGYVIITGSCAGGLLIKNVNIPAVPTYTMNNGDFFVGMSGGSTVILPTSPPTGMVVIIGDMSNSAHTYPITIVGSIVGCTSTSQINTNSGSLSYVYNGSRWNVFAFSPALA